MTATAFWDRVAQRYAQKPVDDPDAYRRKLDLVASLLRPEDNVLEIGCGTGTTALTLSAGVSHYVATDASRAMIEIAQAKAAPVRPPVFRQLDAAAPVEGAPFDAVFAFSLLHLVDDIPGVLAAIRSQLKPGGLFLSKTVCARDAALPVRLLVRLLIPTLTTFGFAPRLTLMSEAELLVEIEAAGFSIERTIHFGRKRTSPFVIARVLRADGSR
jgi:SAM-dependent methyltransferase